VSKVPIKARIHLCVVHLCVVQIAMKAPRHWRAALEPKSPAPFTHLREAEFEIVPLFARACRGVWPRRKRCLDVVCRFPLLVALRWG
jgi:hypothetical protein